MTFELLSPDEIAALDGLALTYPDVGATAGTFPTGYRHISQTRELPPERDFEGAARDLLTWQVQQRAGLRVAASSARVEPAAVTTMRLGLGRMSIAIPCRVVYVVDEPDRCGFAYGTLPGHPESGEEAFVLGRRADGRVEFTVSAFSRPGTMLARLGGPVGRRFQHVMTRRYRRALDR